MAGFWQKLGNMVMRRQNKTLEVEGEEVIEIVRDEEKVFNELWGQALTEKNELMAGMKLESAVIKGLSAVKGELVRLEELEVRIIKEVEAHKAVRDLKPDLAFIRGHKQAVRQEIVTIEELNEGEKLAIDVDRKLRTLKGFAKRIMADDRLGQTTAAKINSLVKALDRRMNKIKKIFIGQKKLAELNALEQKKAAA